VGLQGEVDWGSLQGDEDWGSLQGDEDVLLHLHP